MFDCLFPSLSLSFYPITVPSPSSVPKPSPSPVPTPSPSPVPTPSPSPVPTPSPSPVPTPSPSSVPTPSPSPVPTPSPSPVPTPSRSPVPTPSPLLVPTPSPSPVPTPSPSLMPTPLPVASANTLPVTSANTLPIASAKTLPVASANTLPVASANTLPVASANTLPIASANTLRIACANTLPIANANTLPVARANTLPIATAKPLSTSSNVISLPLELSVFSFTFTIFYLFAVKEMASKHHPHFVRLLGYCIDIDLSTRLMEQILVYEFMPNHDLESWIDSGVSHPLSLRQRLDVLIGVAKGLQYLHDFGIVHRDIKPANILLDAKMQACQYCCQDCRLWACEACFGVVMLVVITARKAVHVTEDNQINLKQWVASLVDSGAVLAFKDPHLDAQDDLVLRWARLALSCTAMPAASRPSMNQVLWELVKLKQEASGAHEGHVGEAKSRIDMELGSSIGSSSFSC
ncbi:unnamed protein product [Closterium sp. NIES-65]|nr:unnamed protein product [Closterium sp. NIES-65]